MTGDEYIQQVLANYAVSYGPDSPAIQAANAIAPTLSRWAGDLLVELLASGSYAKRTAIAGGTDIDIFISLKPSAPTLQELYKSLAQLAKEQGWNPRAQNVSIGIAYNRMKIDLFPAGSSRGTGTTTPSGAARPQPGRRRISLCISIACGTPGGPTRSAR